MFAVATSTRRWVMVAAAVAVGLASTSCLEYHFKNPEPYVGFRSAAATPTAGGAEKPTQPGQTPIAAPPAPLPPGPVTVSVSEAVMMALENNQGLVVQKLNTPITRTFEQNAWSQFDPDLTAALGYGGSNTRAGPGMPFASASGIDILAGYQQFFPAGTTVTASAETRGSLLGSTSAFTGSPFFGSRVGMTVSQALLRGYGADVNLVTVHEAQVDTRMTEYELRGFTEALVAQVEETYWNYAFAQRSIEIFNESLKLAEKQLAETNERIKVGNLAVIERAAAEAEVALRRENLINARSVTALTRLNLLRLLNPTAPDFWSRDVTSKSLPAIPDIKAEPVDTYVQVSMRMRPDLNQARLQVKRDDFQLIKTKNGLLPQMNVFISLGKTGYAHSFFNSYGNLANEGYDALVGATFEYPPLNRDARATNQRAELSRHQAVEAVENVAQLVQTDVRAAYIEMERSKEQVAATAVTRGFQEQKVAAETEKFRVGKSTTLLVAQAQRDLLQSQIDEVAAVVSYLKAWVELYRLDGSLLERRGVDCPGRTPVEMPPARL